MTVEEKKVIEYWEEKLKEYKKEIEQRQNDEFKGYGTAEDIAKLKYCNLHTLLNLIQTQQKEIEKVSSEFAIGKRQYEQLIDDYDELNLKNINQQKELEKKDKIIDEMAEQIYDEWYIPNIKTIDDVKEYFINKVEKEYKDDN